MACLTTCSASIPIMIYNLMCLIPQINILSHSRRDKARQGGEFVLIPLMAKSYHIHEEKKLQCKYVICLDICKVCSVLERVYWQ